MKQFFEARVKYTAIDEQSGKQKKVNLPYLVDAVSYTEAEARIHSEMEQYVSGEFDVPSIKKANYTELFFYDDGDKWYKVKVQYISIDEAAGKEKKVSNTMLIMASSTEEANERIKESLSSMTVDYEIKSVIETGIMYVFIYQD